MVWVDGGAFHFEYHERLEVLMRGGFSFSLGQARHALWAAEKYHDLEALSCQSTVLHSHVQRDKHFSSPALRP